MARSIERRYSVASRWFHWLTTLLVFLVIPLGWIYGGFKTKPDQPDVYVAPFPGTPADYASAHFTIGLLILSIVLARLVYQILHPPPLLPGRSGFEAAIVKANHLALYAVLVAMPLSGYVMMAGDKPPIVILGLFDLPKLPITKAQGFVAAVTHVYTQFAVYLLLVLHLAGVCWHLFVKRDDLLSRMLPPQSYPE